LAAGEVTCRVELPPFPRNAITKYCEESPETVQTLPAVASAEHNVFDGPPCLPPSDPSLNMVLT